MLFLPLISCEYNIDLTSELSKFEIPNGTKYVMQNSILSPTKIKFLDNYGKELSDVSINIQGFSEIERDNDNIYFLHSEIESTNSKNISNKKELPTVDIKYDIQTESLTEFNTPEILKDLQLNSLINTYNNNAIAIYNKVDPENKGAYTENIIYNLTTNEIISENLYNITSVEKINNTYYILSYFDNYPKEQGYKLISLDTKKETMSTMTLNIPFSDDNKNTVNPLKFNLLVLNDKLHVVSPNGTISTLENNALEEVTKITSSNSPEFVTTVKSNGNYAYISVQDAIYNKNSTTKKYFIIDKNYKVTEIKESTELIVDDSTVELYNDKISIFTQSSNSKDLQNTNFFIIEYPLDTLTPNIIDLTSLYNLSDDKEESFIPSKPINIQKLD